MCTGLGMESLWSALSQCGSGKTSRKVFPLSPESFPSNQVPVQTFLLVHSFKSCMHPKCQTQPLWRPCPAEIMLLSGRAENISQCANFTCFPALSAPQWLMAMAMAWQKTGGQCTCNKEPAVTERIQVCGLAYIPRERANQPACYRELVFILLGNVWKHGGKGTTSEFVSCSQKSEFKAFWTPGCKTDLHCSRCKKKKFKAQSVETTKLKTYKEMLWQ